MTSYYVQGDNFSLQEKTRRFIHPKRLLSCFYKPKFAEDQSSLFQMLLNAHQMKLGEQVKLKASKWWPTGCQLKNSLCQFIARKCEQVVGAKKKDI
jgi:hypothetical protein